MNSINTLALIVGYAVLLGGGLAGASWLIWWLIGRFFKWVGFWPLFYKTLMRVGREEYERKRQR
jgi:hypothetical protein